MLSVPLFACNVCYTYRPTWFRTVSSQVFPYSPPLSGALSRWRQLPVSFWKPESCSSPFLFQHFNLLKYVLNNSTPFFILQQLFCKILAPVTIPLFSWLGSPTSSGNISENRDTFQNIFCKGGDCVRLPLQELRETKEFRGRTKNRDRRWATRIRSDNLTVCPNVPPRNSKFH